MLNFLRTRWFLLSLVVLITSGLLLGMNVKARTLESFVAGFGLSLSGFLAYFPRVTTAIVIFLMAFSLDSHRLKASFRSPGPIVWASLVNYGFIPLMAWSLMWLQRLRDFEIGLMIAASVPCTMAAASVWTRKARGNDAVSLMVTLTTNAACFVVTPLWLQLTTGAEIDLGLSRMIERLVVTVLIPTVFGQVLRQVERPATFATRHKTPLEVVTQSLLLTLVFYAACKAGTQLAGSGPGPGWTAIALVWATCIVVHLTAISVGVIGAKRFGFAREDVAAVAFASSQKTMAIGLVIATDHDLFGDPRLGIPFAVFPMLMYHASQLFIDTAIADRLAVKTVRVDGIID